MRERSSHPARLAVFREPQHSAVGLRSQGGAVNMWVMLTAADPGKLQGATCLEDSITVVTRINYISMVQHRFGVRQNWG